MEDTDQIRPKSAKPVSRPWYKLHLATWLWLGVLASSLLLVNLLADLERTPDDPYLRLMQFSHQAAGEPREHGWPLVWLVREPQNADGEVSSRLPFGNTKVVEFRHAGFWLNFSLAALLLLGTAVSAEYWNRRTDASRFALSQMTATALVTGLVTLWWYEGAIPRDIGIALVLFICASFAAGLCVHHRAKDAQFGLPSLVVLTVAAATGLAVFRSDLDRGQHLLFVPIALGAACTLFVPLLGIYLLLRRWFPPKPAPPPVFDDEAEIAGTLSKLSTTHEPVQEDAGSVVSDRT